MPIISYFVDFEFPSDIKVFDHILKLRVGNFTVVILKCK